MWFSGRAAEQKHQSGIFTSIIPLLNNHWNFKNWFIDRAKVCFLKNNGIRGREIDVEKMKNSVVRLPSIEVFHVNTTNNTFSTLIRFITEAGINRSVNTNQSINYILSDFYAGIWDAESQKSKPAKKRTEAEYHNNECFWISNGWIISVFPRK